MIVAFLSAFRLRLLTLLVLLFAHVISLADNGNENNAPRLVIQAGHQGMISGLAFSPDDQVIASASADKTIKIWDVRSGRELRTIGDSDQDIAAIAYAPNGKSIAYGDGNGVIRIWNPLTGKMAASLVCAGSRENSLFQVRSLTYSPDGKLLAAACTDKVELYFSPRQPARSENLIILWDLEQGKELLRMDEHAQGMDGQAIAPITLDFAPGGRILASGKSDGSIRLWDVATGKPVMDLAAHGKRVSSIAISPDGRWIASASGDKTIRLWDASTGRQLLELSDHAEPLTSIAFSPDGRQLASIGRDGIAKLWSMPSGQRIHAFAKFEGGHHTVAFSNDGRSLAISNHDGFRVWEANGFRESVDFSSKASSVLAMALSSDDKTLIVGNQGKGSVAFWNLSEGKLSRMLSSPGTPVAGHPGGGLAFSPRGDLVASISAKNVHLWSTTNNASARTLAIGDNVYGPLAFSPDGSVIAVGAWNNRVSILEAASGKLLRELAPLAKIDVSHSQIQALGYSHDGKFLVSAGSAGGIDVWDVATWRRRCSLSEQVASVESMAFFNNDLILASGHVDGSITLWNFSECRKLLTLDEGTSGNINGLAFSRNGQLMASASGNNATQLWNLDGPILLRTLLAHTNSVQTVAFTADSRMLFSASVDGTVRLWRMADGALLATMAAFTDGRWAVTAPDGRFDVADLEDMPHLHWVMPDDPMTPLPLEIFMRDYYEPRLLPRILAGERFAPVRSLAELKRVQPQVKIVGVERDPQRADAVRVSVEVAGARRAYSAARVPVSTAAHDLRLFRNGQLAGYAEGRLAEAGEKPFRQTFVVRLPGGAKVQNFSAYAFNDDRVKSATVQQSYLPPTEIVAARPRAYLINVGVNRHENPAWDLRYAANDAIQIGRVLAARLTAQKKYEAVVTIPLVSDAGTGQLATKANIKSVLDVLAGRQADVSAIPEGAHLRPAAPDDLVLISFSGHGYGDGGMFYLIASDSGAGQDKRLTPELSSHAISSDELSAWLRDVNAGDMAMIVDACHSAASVGAEFKPGPMGSRGLGQLAFDKGMRILAASQADDVALESDLIKHGLLSFALLQNGLEGGLADHNPKDQKIMLEEWLGYGVSRVPALAEEVKSGKLVAQRGIGNGRGVVLLSGGQRMKKRVIQQPSLFDFTKGRRDVTLQDAGK